MYALAPYATLHAQVSHDLRKPKYINIYTSRGISQKVMRGRIPIWEFMGTPVFLRYFNFA